MRRLPSIVLLLFVLCLSALEAKGQVIAAKDSSERVSYYSFKPRQLIAPVVLVGSGVAIHAFAHDTWDVCVRNKMQEWSGGVDNVTFDDYIQYIPIVMDLGLGLVGVQARNGVVDRIIAGGMAFGVCGLLSWTTKLLSPTDRPNGGIRSYPSGHSITTFTAAELVRIEYGWGWGAAAYAIATTVGVTRMYRDWHWLSDVLAGAGMGILSANIGYWMLDPAKKLLHIPTIRWGDGSQFKVKTSFAPGYDSMSGSVTANLCFVF